MSTSRHPAVGVGVAIARRALRRRDSLAVVDDVAGAALVLVEELEARQA